LPRASGGNSIHIRLILPLNPLLRALRQDEPMIGAVEKRRSPPGKPGRKTGWGSQMARLEMHDGLGGEVTPHAATADILFELGLMYCIGRGVGQDYVTAHKWFNLAAMKGCEEARIYRFEISREMTTSEVHEAQKQARAWMTLH
jgi:uncharacterized protein